MMKISLLKKICIKSTLKEFHERILNYFYWWYYIICKKVTEDEVKKLRDILRVHFAKFWLSRFSCKVLNIIKFFRRKYVYCVSRSFNLNKTFRKSVHVIITKIRSTIIEMLIGLYYFAYMLRCTFNRYKLKSNFFFLFLLKNLPSVRRKCFCCSLSDFPLFISLSISISLWLHIRV